jgi:hypothetical protein
LPRPPVFSENRKFSPIDSRFILGISNDYRKLR